MSIYKLLVHKKSNLYFAPGDEWTNVYHLDEVTDTDAETDAVAIATAEQALYADDVTITRLVLTLPPSFNFPAKVVNANLGGSRTPVGDRLPSWNVARIDWEVAGSARGMRKYYRASLSEDDVDGQVLTSGMIATLDAFKGDLDGITAICLENGLHFSPGTGITDERVQMRQPGWSRRSRPGFHRGYIPNA